MIFGYDTKNTTKTRVIKPRLRYNGKKIHSIENYFPIVLGFLKNRPLGATELAHLLGKSREHVSRSIMKKMIAKQMIENIPSTGKYQIKGHDHTPRSFLLSLFNEHDFYQCGTIKRWRRHALKTKNGYMDIITFKRLCMGEKTNEFKINPDTWIHPETTEECIDVLLKFYGTANLNQYMRAMIRHFLKYGLELNISTEEAKRLGIGGHKDAIGKYAAVSFQDDQYNLAKSWLKSHYGPRIQSLFAVRFWTFCRPSVSYTVRINQLQFYDRDIEYIKTNRKSIILAYYDDSDKRIVINHDLDLLPKDNLEIIRETKRACYIPDLLEFKTRKAYPKYILDDELACILENYALDRKKDKFRYLFWDSDIDFNFSNYTKLVHRQSFNDNQVFKNMFAGINCVGEIFEHRANYSLRHVGVQHWLEMTNYDFDLISEMGWEDISTLRLWYGRRNRRQFEIQLVQALG